MVATVTTLTSTSATVRYFERDGYYAKHDPEHEAASRWHGKAARTLGLGRRTSVDPGRFHSVLAGHVPKTGIRLGRIQEGKLTHLPGLDITFSAPKSVSLEALVYATPTRRARILRAHDRAVRATLDFIEAELLETRVHNPATGRRERVRAHGLVAGTFRHVASRDLDPQLHTHAVVANMTRDAAGRWRSLEPGVLKREEKLLGAYYRNELARRLMGAGCVLTLAMAGPVPSFEVAGYAQGLLDWFSNRRRAILRFMRERGWTYSAAAAQAAALMTRARKAEPDRSRLVALWERRADAFGHGPRSERGRGEAPEASALEVVWGAAAHLEERQSVFSESALRTYALGHAPGRRTLKEIDEAVNGLRRDGHLVDALNRGGARRFVTDRAVRAEKEIIARMKQGRGAGAPLAAAGPDGESLVRRGLSEGQAEAVRTIVFGEDRVVGVQGYAGTGKTAMLREVARLVGAGRIIALAPTAVGAQAMSREAGLPARTLQSFLTRFGGVAGEGTEPREMAALRARFGGGVVILDEASMVGALQMRDLMRVTERLGVERLALVGDSRQLRAVSAGQPFRQLQEAGMRTALMARIVRQRNPVMREAVEAVLARDPARAVALLGGNVHEVDLDELGRAAAAIWLELDPDSRAGTAILAPTHALRARVNEAVREGLEGEGALHGREMVIERLISRGMTAAQKGDIRHYLEGDEVVFHHTLYGGKARAGEVFAIEAIEGERVRLRHADGRVLGVKPSGKKLRYQLDVFRTAALRLRAGDAIRWTRNDNGRGLFNGARAVVLEIGARKVRLRTQDGRTVPLSPDDVQLRHLDHAWSSTVHAAQGSTVDNVIAVLDSGHESLADQAMLYVELSRARDKAVLLTDDRERLIEELEARTGEAMTALEASGEDEGIERSPGEILEFLAGGDTPVRAPSEGPVANTKHRGERGELTDLCAALGESRAERERLAELAGAGRRAVWEVEGYAAWREAATGLLEAGARVLGAPEHQAPLAASPDLRERIGRFIARLETERDADDRHAAFEEGWGRVSRGAAAAGIHRFRVGGYGEVISQAEALARHEGVASWTRERLTALLGEYEAHVSSRATVEEFLKEVEARAEGRRRLERAAAEQDAALVDMAQYGSWRSGAAALMERGRRIMDGEALPSSHLDEVLAARGGVAAGLETVNGWFELEDCDRFHKSERENAALARGEAREPFEMAGYARLVTWAERLAGNPGLPETARERVAAFLDENRAGEARRRDRGAVEAFLAGAKQAEARRQDIEALPDPGARMKAYARWRESNGTLAADALDILAEPARFAPHLEALGASPEAVAKIAERMGARVRDDARRQTSRGRTRDRGM